MRNRPDKVTILQHLKAGGFNVPDFIYLPAEDIAAGRFDDLEAFLVRWRDAYKVIVRSAHPLEAHYKGGTFDSLEAAADVTGVQMGWRRMVQSCRTAKRLQILRQQIFDAAPAVDPEEMGILVMPFIEGRSIMAKTIDRDWEFGYCNRSDNLAFRDPVLTATPHDARLSELSQTVQDYLGFRCEIEYVQSDSGRLYVVQARDITGISTGDGIEPKSRFHPKGRGVRLDGVHRVRNECGFRERPVYLMDIRGLFLRVIDACEDYLAAARRGEADGPGQVLDVIDRHEKEMETFALTHRRFAVLGWAFHLPELFQVTDHLLSEMPEARVAVADALRRSQYSMEYFLAEADTLIAPDRIRFNLCTHNAYGISTVCHPLWTVFWEANGDRSVHDSIRGLGLKTGDPVGIRIDSEGFPTLYRL